MIAHHSCPDQKETPKRQSSAESHEWDAPKCSSEGSTPRLGGSQVNSQPSLSTGGWRRESLWGDTFGYMEAGPPSGKRNAKRRRAHPLRKTKSQRVGQPVGSQALRSCHPPLSPWSPRNDGGE